MESFYQVTAILTVGIALTVGCFSLLATLRKRREKLSLRFQKVLALRESQWQSLIRDIQLIVLNTDTEERITYINPYGVRLLNYKDASELINTNWSDHFFKPQHANSKNDFGQRGMTADGRPANRISLVTKNVKE